MRISDWSSDVCSSDLIDAMRRLHPLLLAPALLLLLLPHLAANAADRFIVVQSTTSTQNSGLFDAILPKFTGKTGIEVRVVAVGTGQAIRNAANGDGDVLLVHARAAADKVVDRQRFVSGKSV